MKTYKEIREELEKECKYIFKDTEEALMYEKEHKKFGTNLPMEEVKKSEKKAKLWVELREKYPDDEELKNLSLEEMSENDEWYAAYEEELYEKHIKEIDFISRAKAVGLPTIVHNGIEKVLVNLQKPVILSDDFLFPMEFNHLVYITCEK